MFPIMINITNAENNSKVSIPLWKKILKVMSLIYYLSAIFLFGYILYFVYPFFSTMESIRKIPQSYFEKTISDGKIHYKQVTTHPTDWVSLNQISKKLVGAIVSSEDGKFFTHPGYDIEELQDAISDGVVKKKKKVRGASTITQQLIKNLYFQSDRSLWRKSKEMLLTLWIEDHVEKKKILETYLNVIEFGKDLYGIDKATHYYFKKKASQLNARESAFLAMLLPSPKRYAYSFQRRILTPFAEKMIHSILFKMLQGGYIGVEEYYENLSRKMTWERNDGPENTSVDIGDR